MYKNWDLSILFKGLEDEKFTNYYKDIPNEIKKLVSYAKNNFENIKDAENSVANKIETFIKMYNDFSKYYNVLMYAQLILEVDSENIKALKVLNTVENYFTELTVADTLFKKYLLEIKNLESIIDTSPLLTDHKFILLQTKENASHMLEMGEEIVFEKLKLTGSNAWSSMYGQVISNLEVDININGDSQQLSLSQVRNMADEEDPYLRKTAYYAELNSYSKIEKPIAQSLNAIKGEAITTAHLRGYDSVLDMTLKNSRMDKKTLDVLISTIKDALPIFKKYFNHKAKLLGHSGALPFYDLFAPVKIPFNPQKPVNSNNLQYTKQEAVDFIVKNFSNFSKDLGDFANNAFQNNWIDWDPKKGKSGGAFCANLHNVKESRILANFSGSFGDILTLAHELGHAYHGEALKDSSFLNSNYSMPIAEVASTFCETLVCNVALKSANKAEALSISENNLQNTAQVIIDIYSRYLFETEVIKRREYGSLSVDEFKEIMVDSQQKAYGDSLSSIKHPYMWICKGHYYSAENNFYNFPYAYGLLFAKGLYTMYLNEGQTFAQKYKALLAATGQNNLYEVGRTVSINVHDKAFWDGALDTVEKEIDEFIKIC